MSGLKLGKPVVDTLCHLAGTLTLSGLILGGTGIGTVSKTYLLPCVHFIVPLCLFQHAYLTCSSDGIDIVPQEGAIKLAESLLKGTEELVKLDLSYCGLTSDYILNINVKFFCSIVELNLEGNPIMLEVCSLYL